MSEKTKYVLIASIAVVVLLVATFIPMIFGGDAKEEPSESAPVNRPKPVMTTIKGFKEQVENLPDSRIELIEENLSWTIKANGNGDVTDAVIRDGTYKQTLEDSAKQIFFTTFIVDIPSIKQSYRVNDYYSPLPAEMSGLFDYATLVLCLDAKDLIYGEFECTDRIRMEQGR